MSASASLDTTPTGFGAHWLARLGTQSTGDVVTFYSYKGGTGRSMALVNCAGLIAQHLPSDAKPILLIDFDLEAPGLHRYLAPYLDAESGGIDNQGVLELFDELRRRVDLALPVTMPDAPGEAPRLADDEVAAIVDALELHEFIDGTRLDNLKLMTAGRFDDTYDRRVTRFDWEGLHTKAPALFRCVAERLSRDYSFTFVDSRTGLSDTSGICTMLLPDVLVMVFTPNQQSLTGISHLVRKAVDYRNGAADTRALRIYPLPSRVDNQVENFRQIWRMGTTTKHELFGFVIGYQPIFREIFGSALGMEDTDAPARLNDYFDVVQVPHSADYSYGERLCFLSSSSSDSLSVRGAYEQFLPWLVTGAQPWQRPADTLLNQQAAAWLRDAGADAAPDEDEDGWTAWFDRLAGVLQALPAVALARLTASPEHGFEVALAAALGMAWRDDLVGSTACLRIAGEAFGEDLACILPDAAPAALLQQWTERLTPSVLGGAERKAWLAALDAPLRRWQTLKTQKMRWLSVVAELAHKAAWLDDERRFLAELVSVKEETFGGEHAQTLDSKSRLARALHAVGLLGEARRIDEQLLDIQRRTLGEEHPDTLESMNNLAETFRVQGDFAGARELQQTALAARRRVFDDEHLDTLRAMSNLAATLWAQGDLAGARELQQTVLAVRRRVLGYEHPDTLRAMNNLAETLQAQGDLAGARQLHQTTLAVGRRVLGDEHPGTLTSMNNFALMLRTQGDLTGARELQQTVLAVFRRVLGEEHPGTLTSMNNLALTLRDQGDLAGARELHQAALAVRRRVLGDEHPDTLTSMNNLAETLQAQGDLAGARELQETVLAIRRRVLGDEHPDTLTSMNNFAVTLWQTGERSEAVRLMQRAAVGLEGKLGVEQPRTLAAKQLLAKMMFEQGEISSAIALQRQILDVSQQVLGASHPDTLQTTSDFANMLRESGDLEAALTLYEEAFTAMSATLGAADERTWSCAMALATVALELAQPKRAAEVLDSFNEPRQTTDNASWVGLRLRVAERLADRETVQRLNRRQYELLKPQRSALR